MTDLEILVREYALLEDKVRTAMSGVCVANCSVCTRVCCCEELCRETIESTFLCLLRQQSPPMMDYSSDVGWLTKSGCALSIGRAPVCYHFLCDDILTSQPSPVDRIVLKALAALVTHIGKNALGHRHLVEIMDRDDLNRVKLSRFRKKIREARAALNVIMDYYKYELVEDDRFTTLSRIQPFTTIDGLLPGGPS